MSDHTIRVERWGPQRFRPTCSCGWVGTNRKGTDPWNKAAALAPVFAHQREFGLPEEIPGYVDMDPVSSRAR